MSVGIMVGVIKLYFYAGIFHVHISLHFLGYLSLYHHEHSLDLQRGLVPPIQWSDLTEWRLLYGDVNHDGFERGELSTNKDFPSLCPAFVPDSLPTLWTALVQICCNLLRFSAKNIGYHACVNARTSQWVISQARLVILPKRKSSGNETTPWARHISVSGRGWGYSPPLAQKVL